MAKEQNKDTTKGGLRLPKFLTEPISLPGLASAETSAASPNIPDSVQVETPISSAVEQPSAEQIASGQSEDAENIGEELAVDNAAPISAEEAQFQYFEYLVSEFQQMQGDMQRMYGLVQEISERETAQEKIFNTLHAELRDYKNDFIYEHLKPIVRPLLFLFDSLEQFDAEIALYERPSNGERRQVGLSPVLVRENISFFRDQLIEALRICEVAPMESPKGAFNPRLHKVIDVVPVEAKEDGLIQRVVRGGWYLNGQLLRSAEVIVGKKMA